MASEEPHKGYRTPVDCSKDLLWSLLLDKIRHPDKYLPVTDVKVLEEGNSPELGEWIMRNMVAPGGQQVKEKIWYKTDELLVVFQVQDDPGVEGAIYNKIHLEEGGKVSLEFWSDHKPKAGVLADNDPFWAQATERMKGGVLSCKAHAEKFQAEGKTSV